MMLKQRYIEKFWSYPINRDIYFDNIKGKLILLVVLGHLLEFKISYDFFRFVYVFLYSFVMPVFCFVSGMFFKMKFKNIIKIFVIYCIAQLILLLYLKQICDIGFKDFLTPIWALWYLLCLFYWYCILGVLKKLNCPKWVMVGLAIAVSYLGGFVGMSYFLSFQRACAYLIFFTLGTCIDKVSLKRELTLIKKDYKLYFVAMLGMLIIWIIYQESFLPRAFYNSYSYYNFFPYPAWYMFLVRVFQFILIFIFGIFLFKSTTHNKNFYTWCGYNCLWIYLIHTFVLFVMKN